PHAAPGGLGHAADPEGEPASLGRLRLHGHRRHAVVPALEVHLGVAPAGALQPDGLVHPGASRAEVLAERLVLRLLPADADADVVVADLLDPPGEAEHGGGAFAVRDAREFDAELHDARVRPPVISLHIVRLWLDVTVLLDRAKLDLEANQGEAGGELGVLHR